MTRSEKHQDKLDDLFLWKHLGDIKMHAWKREVHQRMMERRDNRTVKVSNYVDIF